MATDVPLILDFIHQLARYEKAPDQVEADEERLRSTLFGPAPAAEVLLAFWDGEAAGFAVFFHNYSTWLAKRGLYLEDLFVRPQCRGRGIGAALLTELARLAVERDCGRMEWSVLDWNDLAIGFYRSLGAVAMNEWTVYRVSGAALQSLAAGDSGR